MGSGSASPGPSRFLSAPVPPVGPVGHCRPLLDPVGHCRPLSDPDGENTAPRYDPSGSAGRLEAAAMAEARETRFRPETPSGGFCIRGTTPIVRPYP